jgi:hypothetical protein
MTLTINFSSNGCIDFGLLDIAANWVELLLKGLHIPALEIKGLAKNDLRF